MVNKGLTYLQPGKTYRLRIVNTSAFAMFFFWIDGHDMRIIEVDGVRISLIPAAPPLTSEHHLDRRRGIPN